MNFYDFVFCANTTNLAELRVVFSSISSAMKGNIKCNGDLASYFKTPSGSEILRHGYSIYTMPTSHHVNLFSGTDRSLVAFTRLTSVDPAAYAAAIRYLAAPTTTGTNELTQPRATCNTDRSHPTTVNYTSILNRLHSTVGTPLSPAAIQFETFNEDRHMFPRVMVLNPTDPSTIDAWKATAFGMVIESFELDGTVIPMPNALVANGIENSWFADSAVPYQCCFWSMSFPAHTATTIATPRIRTLPRRQTLHPAASILVDRSKVNLPRFNPLVRAPAHNNMYFAGLSFIDFVSWPTKMQSFFGFNTADRRTNANNCDIPVGTPTGQLLVWSPYTYTAYTDETDFTPNFARQNIYFITNLRTLFGTRIPLVTVAPWNEAMPAV